MFSEIKNALWQSGAADNTRRFGFWFAVVAIEVMITVIAVISPLTGITLLILLGAAFLLLKPEYALLIVIWLIYPAPAILVSVFGMEFTINHFAMALAAVAYALAMAARTRPRYPRTAADLPLLIFTAWAFLSLLWSKNLYNGVVYGIWLAVASASFYVPIGTLLNERLLQTALGIILFFGLMTACMTWCYPFTPDTWYYKGSWSVGDWLEARMYIWPLKQTLPEGRAMAFGTAHSTSALMILPLTFAAARYMLSPSARKRAWYVFLMILMFGACTATLVKSPFGGILLGLAYFAYHIKPMRRHLCMILFAALVLAVVLFCLSRIENIGTDFKQVLTDLLAQSESGGRETSLGNRIVAWTIGAKKLWETAGLGTGMGGFNQYLPFRHIDGTYPAVVFELGFIGLALYGWVLYGSYLVFVRTIKTCASEYYKRMLTAYLGGYVAILFTWIVSFSYIHIFLWFYLSLGFVMVRLARIDTVEVEARKLPFAQEGESLVIYK